MPDRHRITVTTEQLSYIVGALRTRLDEVEEQIAEDQALNGVASEENRRDYKILLKLNNRLTRIGSLVGRDQLD